MSEWVSQGRTGLSYREASLLKINNTAHFQLAAVINNKSNMHFIQCLFWKKLVFILSKLLVGVWFQWNISRFDEIIHFLQNLLHFSMILLARCVLHENRKLKKPHLTLFRQLEWWFRQFQFYHFFHFHLKQLKSKE